MRLMTCDELCRVQPVKYQPPPGKFNRVMKPEPPLCGNAFLLRNNPDTPLQPTIQGSFAQNAAMHASYLCART